jgi:hypothetical protein
MATFFQIAGFLPTFSITSPVPSPVSLRRLSGFFTIKINALKNNPPLQLPVGTAPALSRSSRNAVN